MRNIIIPAYEYPGNGWAIAFANAESIFAMIFNPHNGPGASYDDVYRGMADRWRALGAKVLGYSFTSYGARSPIEIQNEIQNWKDWYGVDGIFYDETSSSVKHVGYYGRLCGIAKTMLGTESTVILNPGAIPDPVYASVADIICTAETDQKVYLGRDFPRWEQEAKAYHIAYGVTDVASVLAKMARVNADYIYLTSVDRINGKGPEYDVAHSLFPPKPTTPTTGSSPNSTESWSSLTLQEVASIIGMGAKSNLGQLPAKAREKMARLAYLESQSALRIQSYSDEEILADLKRRMGTRL